MTTADIDPVWLNLFRWAFAFLILLPLAWPGLRRDASALRAHLGQLLILSGLGIVAFNTVLYLCLKVTPASEAAIGFAPTPLLIALFSALSDRRSPQGIVLIAAAISLAGVWVMQSAEGGQMQLAGSLRVLPASVIWALYCVLLARFAIPAQPLSSFTAQIGLGLIIQTLLAGLTSPPPDMAAFLPGDWAAIAYLGLGASALAFLAWQTAIRSKGADFAGPFMNLVPLSSVFLAALCLGERISGTQMIGAYLIALGLLCQQISLGARQRRTRPNEKGTGRSPSP